MPHDLATGFTREAYIISKGNAQAFPFFRSCRLDTVCIFNEDTDGTGRNRLPPAVVPTETGRVPRYTEGNGFPPGTIMILKVARLGHPVLRQVARDLTPEEIASPETRRLVDDMIATMREYEGVGLAAPQVHQPLRILVMEVRGNPRYPDAPEMPLTALLNLHIEPIGGEMVEDWEGCLSVPGMRGRVPRHNRVRARALSLDGEALTIEAEGFAARVLQHEGDHLDGRVYLDQMRDMRSLSFLEEFRRHQSGRSAANEA